MADLFCGAGGTSTALVQVCADMKRKLNLTAVNHWATAISTHTANHPAAEHICWSLESLDPMRAVPGGRLDLLVASPECTHHSRARGGKPIKDQSRASAWHVARWAEMLRPESILIENVPEFRDWGPLDKKLKQIPSRKGEIYRAYLSTFKAMGYHNIEERILNAADYGDPTTRKRLFIQMRLRRPIVWPEPTHAVDGVGVKRWRAARTGIDLTMESRSVFGRKIPLRPKTLARIAAGLRKFGSKELGDAFLVVMRNHQTVQSIESPAPTITAGGGHLGLCEVKPFLVSIDNGSSGERSGLRSLDEPTKTITTKNGTGLVQPFLVTVNHGGGEDRRCHSADDPAPTITTKNGTGLIQMEPFVVPYYGAKEGEGSRARSVEQPVPTITTENRLALVQPFVVKYNGTGGAKSIDVPIDTIPTKGRFGLVMVEGVPMDVHFRMLKPRELAALTSFPADYQFAGTQEQMVKQIGNAVPIELAKALFRALLG